MNKVNCLFRLLHSSAKLSPERKARIGHIGGWEWLPVVEDKESLTEIQPFIGTFILLIKPYGIIYK